jgi:hypothetical protein
MAVIVYVLLRQPLVAILILLQTLKYTYLSDGRTGSQLYLHSSPTGRAKAASLFH